MTQETKWLPVDLDPAELLERGQALSQRLADLSTLEAEKAAAMRDYKKRISDIEGDIANLSDVVRTGKERRVIPIRRQIVGDRMNVIRCDTGELIEDRKLTEQERQMDLQVF